MVQTYVTWPPNGREANTSVSRIPLGPPPNSWWPRSDRRRDAKATLRSVADLRSERMAGDVPPPESRPVPVRWPGAPDRRRPPPRLQTLPHHTGEQHQRMPSSFGQEHRMFQAGGLRLREPFTLARPP